jgi:hypothetical protein
MRLSAVTVVMFLIGCQASRNPSSQSARQLQRVIVDPKSSGQMVIDAYSNLDELDVDEDPHVWARAASDRQLSRYARDLSFAALFRRFAHPPLSLSAFVRTYDLKDVKGLVSDENRNGGYPFTDDLVNENTDTMLGVYLWSSGQDDEDRVMGVWLLVSRVVPIEQIVSATKDRDTVSIEVLKLVTPDGPKLKRLWGFN